MEIFVIVKQYLTLLGMLEIKNQKYGPLLSKLAKLLPIIALSFGLLTTSWYFFFRARTFADHSQTGFLIIAFISPLSIFYMIWRHKAALISFLASIQQKADEREFSHSGKLWIFTESRQRVP